jgi:hypothetical protein
MQNKHDIQNQHQNLHQVTCVLSKNIFVKIRAWGDHREKWNKNS